uniref:Im:7150988 n=1 Tax=Cyprinus carpio TaxID=7962 RepID=A0A8C2BB52_CYPCA
FGKHNDSFKKEFLETHNQYRKQHQAPELRYSDELCSAAQKWADHLLSIRSLAHSDTENGENVFYSSSSVKKTPKGHFTQVVWKSSTELGVGLATDGNTVFVVGQYKPSGNITNAGYYEKNVLPKI